MRTATTLPAAKANSAGPHLEGDGPREKRLQLGLVPAAEALAEERSEAVKHNRPAHQVLDRLRGRVVSERDGRRIKTALQLSGLPPGLTRGNFAFRCQPSLERRPIETLATAAFIREHPTLLVQGPPGVGKTPLVVALGVKAIEPGFRVAFFGWRSCCSRCVRNRKRITWEFFRRRVCEKHVVYLQLLTAGVWPRTRLWLDFP